MLFKNLFIENATEAMDIRVTDGKFEKIAASLEALPAGPAPRHRVPCPPGYLPHRRPSPLEHERHSV